MGSNKNGGKGLLELISKALSGFEGKRNEVIPMLQAVQNEVGYLPEEAVRAIARQIGMPESKVYGTATFYSQFYFAPRGERSVKVCLGTACHVRGAMLVMDAMERELGVPSGGTTEDLKFSLERVNCVGSCALAPVVMVGDDVFGRVESKQVKEVLRQSDPEI